MRTTGIFFFCARPMKVHQCHLFVSVGYFTSYLDTKSKLQKRNISLEFWPHWTGKLGFPYIRVNDGTQTQTQD